MRALVTGSTGFLGRHLCRELVRRGWGVGTLQRDVTSIDAGAVDVFFHLAAYTQAGAWCLKHGGEQWLVNQKINLWALDLWKNNCPDAKFITIGSSCAYAPGSNLREEDYMRGEPHESLYTYAMTKRMLYEGCRALNKQYGMRYLYLVPSTLYGPDYHRDGRQAHFIFDLIRKIIRGKELGEPVTLFGDGYQRRDVIHVKDFVMMMLNLNDRAKNNIFNLSTSAETIMTYANTIAQLVGYDDSLIKYDSRAHIGAKDKSLDARKAKDVLKFQFITPLEDGFKETIDWYMETGAWK